MIGTLRLPSAGWTDRPPSRSPCARPGAAATAHAAMPAVSTPAMDPARRAWRGVLLLLFTNPSQGRDVARAPRPHWRRPEGAGRRRQRLAEPAVHCQAPAEFSVRIRKYAGRSTDQPAVRQVIATSVPPLASRPTSRSCASRAISGRPRPAPGLSLRGASPPPSSAITTRSVPPWAVAATRRAPGAVRWRKACCRTLLAASETASMTSKRRSSDAPTWSRNARSSARRPVSAAGSAAARKRIVRARWTTRPWNHIPPTERLVENGRVQHLRAQDRAELRVVALAAAVLAAITIADVLDDDIVMVGLLIAAPLLCGLLGTPRVAAGAGAAAVVLAAASAAWNDSWGHWTYWVPLTVVTLGAVFATVTAALRARLATEARRMELLAEVAHVAEGRLDARATARAITSLVAGLVCDVAVIDLLDRDGAVRRVAGALDGDRALLDAVLAREPSPIPRRLQHFTTVGEELLGPAADDEAATELRRRLRLQSAVLVPLVARERTIGALILATRPGRARLEAPDAEYFEVLAGRVALAIDNALLSRELTTTEGQLEAILSTVDAAVMVRDVDGELVYANQAAANLLRLPDADGLRAMSSDALMDRFDVYTEDGRRIALTDLPGARLLSGDDTPEPMIVRSVVRATGEERWLLAKASSVTDVDGRVLMAVNLIEDVTATKRSEVAQRLLAETARAVAEADDLDHTLQLVAEAAVPGLADWASVDLVDDRGRIAPVAIAHRDPEKVRLGWELRTRWPVDPARQDGLAAVMASGTPWLLPEVDDAVLERVARDAEHLATLRAIGMTSTMI